MTNVTVLSTNNARIERYRRNSEAYHAMEGPLHDCVRMAQITGDLMSDADNGTSPKLVFAVYHLVEMIENLEEHYRADFRANASTAAEEPT